MGKTSYDVLSETRSATEEIMSKMLVIKKEGKNRSDLKDLITQASVTFLNLRQINRILLQDEDRAKVETEAAKAPVDQTSLQLHNLLYEKNHYLKAIKACKDFKSKYPDIELVSEEVFFRDAPDEYKRDAAIIEDAHKRMLERLNFELYQRKELCKQRELLEARKKMLQESIANRNKFISSLPSHLKALRKASLPLQQHLGILHTKRMKQHQLAELLPTPLYIIYSQLLSHKEAFDENIDLEIVGSAKDAQALARHQASKDLGLHEDTKLEDDVPDDDEDSQRHRKRSKKVHQKEGADGGLYQSHPLSVIAHIHDNTLTGAEKQSKLLTLRFEYLLKLHVVCAGSESSHNQDLPDLFTNLFPDDTGLDLPSQVSMLSAGPEFHYDEKRQLRPYKWVQHLAGMDFLPETPLLLADFEHVKGTPLSNGLALYRQQWRVGTVLQKIRERKKAHMALKDHLDILAKLGWPSLKFTNIPWGFYCPKCTLQSWAELKSTKQPIASVDAFSIVSSMDNVDHSGTTLKEPEYENMREDGELPFSSHNATTTIKTQGTSIGEGFRSYSRSELGYGEGVGTLTGYGSSYYISGTATDDFDAYTGLNGSGLAGDDYCDYNTEEANEAVEVPDSSNCRMTLSWEEFGVREFSAVLRREEGFGGKPVDLEFKVKLCSEYPIRPPCFSLSLVHHGQVAMLPPAPCGVLDIFEKFSGALNSSSFNELRAMENEVNIGLLEKLPHSYDNELLAQQLVLLSFLFDAYVDQELCKAKEQLLASTDAPSELAGHTSRSIRGRDRQRLLL